MRISSNQRRYLAIAAVLVGVSLLAATAAKAATVFFVVQGGTGISSATAHGVIVGEGTAAFNVVTPGDAGKVLTSNGVGSDPTYQTAVGAVSSVFGRIGAVVAQSGDYNSSQVTENTNLYFTGARAIASLLTGYTSGAGTVSASDSILSAIQKLNGNIAALVTGVSSVNGKTGVVTLTTTDIAEGTNQYWTNGRFDARLAATTTLPNLTTLANLGTVKTSLTGILKASSGVLATASAGSDFQAPISLTTTGSGAATFISNVLNIPTPTTGTVTSVGLSAPTGLTVSGSPVTSSGTLALSLTAGYTIPTTASTSAWDAAAASTTALTNSYIHGLFSGSSPLSYNSGTGAFSIQNAAADGSTKGAASFTANDFDASSGNISIDYTNAQKSSSTTIGFLTTADWIAFNAKQAALALGNLTSGTGLTVTGGTGAVVGSGTSVSAAAGYSIPLTASTTDFQTAFTNRITSLTTTGTSGAATLSGNVLNIPNYAGGVTSVSNSDGTLTVSPTSGAVVASLALGHANTWTGQQTFNTTAPNFGTMTLGSVFFAGTSGLLSQDNANLFYDATNHRLGIGTVSPGYGLDAAGTARVRGILYASKVVAGLPAIDSAVVSFGDYSSGHILTMNAAGTKGITIDNSGTYPTIHTDYFSGSDPELHLSTYTDKNNSNGLFILNGGNVGIGSTTPVATLGVSGSANITGTTTIGTLSGIIKGTSGVLSAATAGTDYAPATSGSSLLYGNGSGGFSNATIGTGLSFSGGTLSSTASGSISTSTALVSGQVDFSTAANTIGNDSTFFWDNTNKRLGIGTSSPSAQLTVNNGAAAASFTVAGTGAIATSFSLGDAADAANVSIWRIIGSTGANSNFKNVPSTLALQANNAGGLILATNAASPAPIILSVGTAFTNEVARAASNGNFGIGTTTPAAKLAVGGNVYFGGTLTATGTAQVAGLTIPGMADGCATWTSGVAGSTGVSCGTGSGGITSLNSLTGSSQTFATSTAVGIGLNISSSGTVHTFTPTVLSGFSIPLTASTTEWAAAYASTTALTPSYIRGLFSNSATGLTYNSTTGATSLTAGYGIPLTASTTDFQTAFTNRITSLTTTGSSGAATLSGNVLNIPQYQAAGTYVTGVTGTSNRITSSGGTTPAIDIAATYVGQTSLTTLGTITTGVWNGTAIANANLANSTISGVSLGGNLFAHTHDATLAGTSYNGSAAVSDWGIDLTHANTWTGGQIFGNATTTNFAITGITNSFLAADATGHVIATSSPGGGTITLSGDVSGSGTTAITTTIGALKVVGSMIANATIDLTTKVTGVLGMANGGTGTNSTTKGDVLLGTGSAWAKLGIGANGTVLTASSTATNGAVWAGIPSSAALNYQDFIGTSGTWTKPAGLSGSEMCVIQMWGSGGAGGSGSASGASQAAAGGGGAEYSEFIVPCSALASTVSVTAGATTTAGSAGNNSTFGSLYTAYGGGAGGGSVSGQQGVGGGGAGAYGQGGSGGTSGANISGGSGGAPLGGTSIASGGAPGGSNSGGGGAGGGASQAGSGGDAWFGGGGGGAANFNTSTTGGSGGRSYMGGGGGGGGVRSGSGGAIGVSLYGGSGGLGGANSNGSPGLSPGGGGGGAGGLNFTGGVGGAGEVRVWVI